MIGGKQLHRESTGDHGFDRHIVVHGAAAVGVDQLTQRRAVGQFVDAGRLDVAAQAEDAHAGAFFGAELLVPRHAIAHDVGDVGNRLHIVDDGGLGVKTFDSGEGWLEAGLSTVTFQAGKLRRLFAALIRTCAAMNHQTQLFAGAKDVFAQVALGLCFSNGFNQASITEIVFATDVDEGAFRLNGVRAHDDPFDQLVGIIFHDDAIFKSAGFRLVGVNHEVAGIDTCRDKAPLHAGGETCAAATADAAVFDLRNYLGRGHLGEDTPRRFVAAVGFVGVDLVAVGLVDARHQVARFHTAEAVRTCRLARAIWIAVRRPPFEDVERLAALDDVEHLFHVCGGVEFLEVANFAGGLLGDGDHGRATTRSQTFHVIEGEFAIRRLLTVVDAQLFFQVVHTFTCAPQHTRNVGADFHVVFALGRFVEHIIEANHRTDFRRSDV